MDNFTRDDIKALRADMQAALDAVAAKHGIALRIKKITYDSVSFRTQLVGDVMLKTPKNGDYVGRPGDIKLRDDYRVNYKFLGLPNPDEVLGRICINDKGNPMRVIGYDRKKRAYPIIIESAADPSKRYKVTLDHFLRMVNC